MSKNKRAVLPPDPPTPDDWESLRRELKTIPGRLAAEWRGKGIERKRRNGADPRPCSIFALWPYPERHLPHAVYALCDPRTCQVFYVGVTGDYFARMRQHCHIKAESIVEGGSRYKPLAAKKHEIISAGKWIGSLVLWSSHDPAVANLFEGMAISELRKMHPLVNHKTARWSPMPLTVQSEDGRWQALKDTLQHAEALIASLREDAERARVESGDIRATLRALTDGLVYDQRVDENALARARKLLRPS